jgi:hypothetical protein
MTIQDRITVTISEELCGFRLGCSTCGSTTEKFEPFGHYYGPAEDDELIVCWRCIERGPVYVAAELVSQAQRLEARAEWCRTIARAEWNLPSVGDLDAEQARRDAEWDMQAAGIPQ